MLSGSVMGQEVAGWRPEGDDVDHKVCADCGKPVLDELYYTQVNPEGGYGQPQLLICDDCMATERWAWWRRKRWPNWPEPWRWG